MVKIARILPRDGKLHGIRVDGYHYDFLKGIRRAVLRHNTSSVIIYDGKSGQGKTTKSFQDAIILDRKFGLPKVHTISKTFLNGGDGKIGLSQAKKGDCIIYDEAMVLSSRSSMSELNRTIVQAMSMIRSKQIFVFFNINSIFDLDRNLVLSRADALVHLYGQHLYDRGNFSVFFKAKDGYDRLKDLYLNGKKFYSYSRPSANYYGNFSKEFVVDEMEYEKQKQAGIKEFLAGTKQGVKVSRQMEQRNNLIKQLHYKFKVTAEKISEMTSLSRPTVIEIINDLTPIEKVKINHGNYNISRPIIKRYSFEREDLTETFKKRSKK